MLGTVADQQVLRGAAATLSWQYLDQDGEAADPGVVTVGVTRADGTVVVAAGAATAGTGDDPRTVTLTAAQTASLDLLVATWTRTADSTTHTTTIEIVGGYYFTISQLRAREPSLADEQKYVTDDLQALRREIEGEFEAITEVAFVPRYTRQRVDGSGCGHVLLPTTHIRRIVAVAELNSDGTTAYTWTAGEVGNIRVAEVTGKVYSPARDFPSGGQNLVVAWEHGYDRAPADIVQAAMLRLRHRATRPRSAVPDRASTFQVEGGNVYRLDQAGRHKTGIPDVDAVLDRYSMAIPGVA